MNLVCVHVMWLWIDTIFSIEGSHIHVQHIGCVHVYAYFITVITWSKLVNISLGIGPYVIQPIHVHSSKILMYSQNFTPTTSPSMPLYSIILFMEFIVMRQCAFHSVQNLFKVYERRQEMSSLVPPYKKMRKYRYVWRWSCKECTTVLCRSVV